MRLFFTIGVSLLSVASGSAQDTFAEDVQADADLQATADRHAAMSEIRKQAIKNAATAAKYASGNTTYHKGNSRAPTSSPSEAPTSAPTSAPTQVPSESPTRDWNASSAPSCVDDYRVVKKGPGLDGGIWYDQHGCAPLLKEVWCPTADKETTDGLPCKGGCVTYAPDGSHCVEVDISGFHDNVTAESGGFHAYPNCSSLDDDTTWGQYDESGVNMMGLKSETWFNTSVEHTDSVPGWYWCQKQMKCLHPQKLRHTDGHKDSWLGTCGDEGSEGNWDDHIFEAAFADKFNVSNGCNTTLDEDFYTQYGGAIFDDSALQPYSGHCKIHELPLGNSYSGKKTTQCASGKVDGCEGDVAFYFSIAGFGHNYNFNFCLSKEVNATTGKRSNDWDNGITPTPAPTPSPTSWTPPERCSGLDTSAHWGFTSNSVACQCNGGSPDVDICQVGTIGPGSTDNVDTCLPIGTSMTTFADYCNAYPGGSCSCCCPP